MRSARYPAIASELSGHQVLEKRSNGAYVKKQVELHKISLEELNSIFGLKRSKEIVRPLVPNMNV